jgi:hypothetical protein
MMLLICIAWILVVANAPWWIWMAFIFHIIFLFISWLFGYDANNIGDYIDNFKN